MIFGCEVVSLWVICYWYLVVSYGFFVVFVMLVYFLKSVMECFIGSMIVWVVSVCVVFLGFWVDCVVVMIWVVLSVRVL